MNLRRGPLALVRGDDGKILGDDFRATIPRDSLLPIAAATTTRMLEALEKRFSAYSDDELVVSVLDPRVKKYVLRKVLSDDDRARVELLLREERDAILARKATYEAVDMIAMDDDSDSNDEEGAGASSQQPTQAAVSSHSASIFSGSDDDDEDGEENAHEDDGADGPDAVERFLDADAEYLYPGHKWHKRILYCDPFLFWHTHRQDYPILFLMAMRHLATPAASSFSERIFSASGIVSGGRRSRMAPDLLQAIMLVKYNLHLLDGETKE